MDTLTHEAHEEIARNLTPHDHCDRCGTHVQAFGAAFKNEMTLHFCGHCINKYSAVLGADGWEILDMTGKINQKPMSGDV